MRIHHTPLSLHLSLQRVLNGRFVQGFVLLFIVLSIAAVIASSFESMHPYRLQLFAVTYLSSFVFLIEFGIRIFAAPAIYPQLGRMQARMRYLCSFYGFVDAVAVLPCVLAYLLWDTPAVHMVVLPYIFIVFKLIRHSQSFRFIGHALGAVKSELSTAYTACLITVCFSAILMYYIEREAQPEVFSNVGQGLWWSIVTFTTVGYGDIYPVTALGKALGIVISLVGISMIAIPTGIISSSFINLLQQKQKLAQQPVPPTNQPEPATDNLQPAMSQTDDNRTYNLDADAREEQLNLREEQLCLLEEMLNRRENELDRREAELARREAELP